jgi:hypothetical protein
MDEAEQRMMGEGMDVTIAVGATLALSTTHEVYCIRAPITGAKVTATHIGGGSTFPNASGVSVATDTYLSAAGGTDQTARTLYGEYVGNFSSVTCDATSPSNVVVLIRNRR